jgi:hypothetical protein
MGRLGGAALALAGALAACSIPEKTLVDGGPTGGPFDCLGKPLPTTAPAKITISGSLFAPFAGIAVPSAIVQGFLVGIAQPIFMVTSNDAGAFTRDQGTGGAPRDTYLRSAPNGYLPTYLYPGVPVAGDVVIPFQMFTSMDAMTIASVAGLPPIDPGKVTFLVTVEDCHGNLVSGATVTTNPPGMVRYFVNTTPSATAIATDASTGTAIIANVDVSNTTVSATVAGMTLRSHNIDGVAGAIIETTVQP